MTNWDKFKDSITPELFGHLLNGWNGEESNPDECDGCPTGCREFCKKCHAEEESEDYDHKDWSIVFKLCEERFVIWAKKEASK